MSADRPSAVVVDDATVIRESVALLMPTIDVVATFSGVEQLVRAAPVADVVILDLQLTHASQPDIRQGIAAVRAVVAAGYRVCVYSQEERRFVLAATIAAGARGVVSKSEGLDVAQRAFREVAAGEVVIPQPLIGLVEVLARRNSLTILSERQRQVLAGRARGFTYAELAEQMHLSESTLRGYWAVLTEHVSRYLQEATPADIEQVLGLGPGDLLAVWPAAGVEATVDPGAGPHDGAPLGAASSGAAERWWRVRPPRRRR